MNFKKRYISLVTAWVLFGLSGGQTLSATDSFITENVATGTGKNYFLTYTDENGVAKGIKLKKQDGSLTSTTGISAIKEIIPQSNTAHGWSITQATGTPSFTFDGTTYKATSSTPTLSGWTTAPRRISILDGENTINKTFFGLTTINQGGGAIWNVLNLEGIIHDITADFINNSVTNGVGGAIYNDTGKLGNITGNFIGNSAISGGGGAIWIDRHTINDIKGDFIANSSDAGGAVAVGTSSVIISSITGDFIGNEAKERGGAIYNREGVIESIRGDFIGNSATGTDAGKGTDGIGGAIYIENGGRINLFNSSFFGNSAGTSGGAIEIKIGTVNISTTLIDGKDSIFSGNTQGTGASKVSNAIHMEETATVNIFASSSEVGKGRVVFNDSITSGDANTIININKTPTGLTGVGNTGTVVINADMSGYTGVTNFYNGTIQVGQGAGVNATTGYTKFFGGSFNVLGANATFSSKNGKIDKFDTSKWTTTAGNRLNIALDVDGTARTSDFFDNKTATTGQTVNISSINLFNPTNLTNESFKVTSNGTNWTIVDGAKNIKVNSPVYIYSYKVDDSKLVTNGEIILSGTDKLPTPDPDGGGSGGIVGVNPGAVASQVASSSSMANMMAVSNQIFNRVERINRIGRINRVSYIDRAINPENYVASIDEQIPLNLEDVRFSSNVQNSVWAQTFGSFDKINAPSRKIDVDTYGALFGFDSKDYNYDSFDMSYTTYLGLSSSDSKYSSMKVEQLNTFVGAGVSFYKNYFTLKTLLTVGYLDNELTNNDATNVFYSNEKFNNITASFGAKIFYDYKIESNYIIQPNLALKYMYVSSNDYTNSANARVETDSLNAIQAVPAVKFVYISNDDTFEVYTQVGYSFLANTEVGSIVAGNSLEGERLGDYAEVNFGLSKDVGNFRLYGQLSATYGGIDGVGIQGGVEWKF